jgi:cholesterol 7-dehydrogenase
MSETIVNKNRANTFNNKTDLPPFYPNGWIPVLESRNLLKSEIKSIITLGHELVVFRGNSGKVHVMDAFCPHLGANLGVGGKVVNDCGQDCIRCPFHGWTFRGKDGSCNKVPGLECI